MNAERAPPVVVHIACSACGFSRASGGTAFASVVQSFPDKVHVAVQFSRWRADGTRIGVYHALYVVTNQGGRFGIQCRSSTAP